VQRAASVRSAKLLLQSGYRSTSVQSSQFALGSVTLHPVSTESPAIPHLQHGDPLTQARQLLRSQFGELPAVSSQGKR